MDYDRLFHQASRGINGTGGGGGGGPGARGYPQVLDGGYASPPMRRVGGGQFGLNQNNLGGNQAFGPGGAPPPQDVARNVLTPTQGAVSVSPSPILRSAPYTKFQVPTTPIGPIPTVQLISSPEGPGLNLDNIQEEWERRGSKSSNRSHPSNRSGGGAKFLGVNTESAWTKWSRERRASYRRRIEKLERMES
ncbi:unnamed protein product, partial [Lymnaea stagnalis]